MLEMRPNCECCDRDLAPERPGAFICSFECTYCAECAERMAFRCPNCGGGLLARPPRPEGKLGRFPASVERIRRPGGCPGLA